MTATIPDSLARAAALVQPALRAAVDGLADDRMRLITGYQLGWVDADGVPTAEGGGKGVRGALTLLAAEAAGAEAFGAVPAAAAVELVHNFSLLHDDVMDRDLERRHRPTGWAVFGEGQAILAGTAMLTLAAQLLTGGAPAALSCLLDATQLLIAGQSGDLLLESNERAGIDDVLRMEAGKTAALLACAAAIGPLAVGAPSEAVQALQTFGHEIGMAFQLVDDVLGIVGDPARTGKSASSDLRAGKRSAPIVAALHADNPAARRLASFLVDGPPTNDEEATLAAKLVEEAGGIEWAERRAQWHTERALRCLDDVGLREGPRAELIELARFLLDRDR